MRFAVYSFLYSCFRGKCQTLKCFAPYVNQCFSIL